MGKPVLDRGPALRQLQTAKLDAIGKGAAAHALDLDLWACPWPFSSYKGIWWVKAFMGQCLDQGGNHE